MLQGMLTVQSRAFFIKCSLLWKCPPSHLDFVSFRSIYAFLCAFVGLDCRIEVSHIKLLKVFL